MYINPYLTNGFSHHYLLGESTVIFRGTMSEFPYDIHCNFQFSYIVFDENPLSKQNSHRWDAAFCGVTSVAILFGYVS